MTRRFSALALFLAFCLSAFPQDAEDNAAVSRKLSWKPVEGAFSYQVKIRDLSGKTVYDKTTTGTELQTILTPGEYEVMITVLNKFMKPAASSPWEKLLVKKLVIPKAVSATNDPFYAGLKDQVLTLTAEGIIEESKVSLVTLFSRIPEVARAEKAPGVWEVTFDLSDAAPGEYGLEIANPPNSKSTAPGKVSILPRIQPVISAFPREFFYNDRFYRGVKIKGSGFKEGLKLFFVNGDTGTKTPIPASQTMINDSVTFNIDLDGFLPGEYTFEISNPGGLSARTVPFAIRKPQPPVVLSAVAEPALEGVMILQLEIDSFEKGGTVSITRDGVSAEARIEHGEGTSYKAKINIAALAGGTYSVVALNPSGLQSAEPVVITLPETASPETVRPEMATENTSGEVASTTPPPSGSKRNSGGISFHIGYPFQINQGELNRLFEYGYKSADLAVRADLGTGALSSIPVLNLLGLELSAAWLGLDGKKAPETPYLNLALVSTSLYARTKFDFPLQLYLKAGPGVTFNYLVRVSPYLKDGSVKTFSQDFAFVSGAALQWTFLKPFSAELGMEYVAYYYALEVFGALRPSLRFGITLD